MLWGGKNNKFGKKMSNNFRGPMFLTKSAIIYFPEIYFRMCLVSKLYRQLVYYHRLGYIFSSKNMYKTYLPLNQNQGFEYTNRTLCIG